MTPSWLTDLLAALMLVVAAYCAGRPLYARLRHRPTEHDVDVLHVLMGVAMAGMLVSGLSFLDNRIWETLFVICALWFVVRAVLALRSADLGRAAAGHSVSYALACGAMLYMYLAPISAASSTGSDGMAGMATGPAAARYPLLGLVLTVAMVGYAVLILDRTPLTVPEGGAGTGALPHISASAHGRLLAPRTANCCHIAMSVTMAYLLVVMF
jgi:Domain of unknown function (DUF5134)